MPVTPSPRRVRSAAAGRWIAGGMTALLFMGAPARGAELFYMDHDPLSNEYVGPVGPLVLSGEIAPGDYERLLAKIAEDENRFIGQNKLIVGSAGGDVPEAIRIATLLKSLYTEVLVGPLTGRCVGACFLIYAAANQRGTDGPRLIGMHRPQAPQDMETSAADFLRENEVPSYLIDEMFRHTDDHVYWLSESDEQTLRAMSPAFERLLAAKCGWNAALERSVYQGERSMEELKSVWACRARLTESAARQALAALREKSNVPESAKRPPPRRRAPSAPTKARALKPPAGAAP